MGQAKSKSLPRSDRKFKAWLLGLPAGKKLGAMSYETCALGLFAKTIGARPIPNSHWSCQIELALFAATRNREDRTITAGKFRKYLGM